MLIARENPFFPVNPQDDSYSTNIIQKQKPFSQASIKLPDSARVLKSITFRVKNIDGSITNHTIKLNNSIDWHKKFIITQEDATKQTDEKKSQKKQKTQKKQMKKKEGFKKIASLKFISFYTDYEKLKIKTEDKLIRDFKLIKPDRIVLDFKRDANFRTYTFKKAKIFKKITLGNHSGYYRAVIELDGKYIYTIKKISDGYLIILH